MTLEKHEEKYLHVRKIYFLSIFIFCVMLFFSVSMWYVDLTFIEATNFSWYAWGHVFVSIIVSILTIILPILICGED